jgi:putative DNA primase/helicase
VIDGTGEVMRRAKDTVGLIYEEASRQDESGRRSATAEHALRSEGGSRLQAMITLAQSEPGIAIQPQDLDADPWKLNVPNGTLDLSTGELLSHSRNDLITKLVPVTYDKDATCPRWCAFLARIFSGDAELIRFVQRALGYSLTGSTKEQVLFLLYGTGANGKSTLLEIFRCLLGDYARTSDFGTFLQKRASGVPNDIARLAGARLVTAQEAENGARLSEVLIKQMTGGDTVQARFLYAEHFEFSPRFKLFLAANHKPEIRGTDHAIWRRIKLIPFAVTIPEREQDKDLAEKLKGELPGILAWAVRGCLEWQRDGLGSPTAVNAATGEYRVESDILASFLAECCVEGSTNTASASDLYKAFKEWAERNGEQTVSQTSFGTQLRERGFEKTKKSGLIFWNGLGILVGDSEDSQDCSSEESYTKDSRERLAQEPSNHPSTIPNAHADALSAERD